LQYGIKVINISTVKPEEITQKYIHPNSSSFISKPEMKQELAPFQPIEDDGCQGVVGPGPYTFLNKSTLKNVIAYL
jgi:hypothetical protein